MRRNVHPGSAADVVRPVVIGEAPRPDQRPLALGQGASHADRARTTQRNLARMQNTGEWRCRTGDFGRRGIGVAHLPTVALRLDRKALFNPARAA